MLHNPVSRLFSSYGRNHFTLDRPFQLAVKYSGLSTDYFGLLTDLGNYAGSELLKVTEYIDRVAYPRLHMWDVDGNRFNWVQLSPAHRQALEYLMSMGIVYRTFVEDTPWQLHYAMGYLIADPGIFCTITLANQTAYALYKYGNAFLKEKYLPRYLEKEGQKVWHGATFYTEIQGGSDLGANRAVARQVEGQWRIFSEDKYFASNAGIADGALVTARPEGNPPGPKGLALFFVPSFRENGMPNYRIRRLKDKLGTRAVPTAEVGMYDSVAYLIGTMEQGIYQALEVLTVARLANAMSALGIARKAYLEAYYYTLKRHTFGKALIQHPLIQKDLLEMEAELEANLLLTLKAVEKFNQAWRATPPYNEDFYYARFFGHVVKNMTAEMSAWVTRMAMELHGGLGFMEDFPIARWHREALVTPIWEGGSNIQALDMLEAIQKKQVHERLFAELELIVTGGEEAMSKNALKQRIHTLREEIKNLFSLPEEDAQYYAKDLLTSMGELAAAAFLFAAGDQFAEAGEDKRFQRSAEIYIRRHFRGPRVSLQMLKAAGDIVQIDKEIK